MGNSRVGIVVPTLGLREEYLLQTLNSIKSSENIHVLLIHPARYVPSESVFNLCDVTLTEAKPGLSSAINFGISNLPKSCEYVTWLGDDDLLIGNSVFDLVKVLDSNPSVTFVYGGCTYIDSNGDEVGSNPSGKWAMKLIKFGPDLIPQPGSLIRRSVFEKVNGVSESYKYAFDQDLFIKLLEVGSGMHVNLTVSAFRWHPNSLSVSQRKGAVKEASKIRMARRTRKTRAFTWLAELLIQFVTLQAGRLVNMRILLKNHLAKRRTLFKVN